MHLAVISNLQITNKVAVFELYDYIAIASIATYHTHASRCI